MIIMNQNNTTLSTNKSIPQDETNTIFSHTNFPVIKPPNSTMSPNSNKFRIVFDKNKIKGLSVYYIDLNKFSNDIILNYIPKYDNINIGTKVLAKLTNQDNEDYDNNKKNTEFDGIGFKTKKQIRNRICVAGNAGKAVGCKD